MSKHIMPPPKGKLVIRQNGRQVNVPLPTVYVDTREQNPYTFDRFPNWIGDVHIVTLKTGDYTIKGLEHELTVERKALSDLIASIIQNRQNFIERCERMATYKTRFFVVEATLTDIKSPYHQYTEAHPNSVLGSLIAAAARWHIPIYMLDNHSLAEEFLASMFSKYHALHWLEQNGYERCIVQGDI